MIFQIYFINAQIILTKMNRSHLHTQDKLEVFWKPEGKIFQLIIRALNYQALTLHLLFLWQKIWGLRYQNISGKEKKSAKKINRMKAYSQRMAVHAIAWCCYDI